MPVAQVMADPKTNPFSAPNIRSTHDMFSYQNSITPAASDQVSPSTGRTALEEGAHKVGVAKTMESKLPQLAVPAGVDVYDNPQLKSELGEDNWGEYFHRMLTIAGGNPVSKALMAAKDIGNMTDEQKESGANPVVHAIKEGIVDPMYESGEILQDVRSRVAGLRRDLADNPLDAEDDPVNKFYVDGGEPFTVDHTRGVDERLVYRQLKNGVFATSDQIKKIFNGDPISYILPNGYALSNSEFESRKAARATEVSPDDPRAKNAQKMADGSLQYVTEWNIGGLVVRAEDLINADRQYQLPDSSVFTDSDVPATPEEWDAAPYQMRTPDGETILVNSDGSVPEELKLYRGEEDRGVMNMAVANPRNPLSDRSGRMLWEPGYDIRHSAWDETLPWITDGLLSSVTGMTPGPVRYSFAAGDSVPYAAGLRGSTYTPQGRGLGNLGSLGRGTYSDEEISKAQAIGGISGAFIDPLAEKLGRGPIIGSSKGWFGPGRLSKWASGAIKEGFEEALSGPSNLMEQDGYVNYGRPGDYNEMTNEWEYDESAPAGLFTQPSISNVLTATSEGVMLGGAYGIRDLLRDTQEQKRNRHSPTKPINLPDIKKRTDPSTLDRRY